MTPAQIDAMSAPEFGDVWRGYCISQGIDLNTEGMSDQQAARLGIEGFDG